MQFFLPVKIVPVRLCLLLDEFLHFALSLGGGGVLPNKEVGGLGPHIKFGGKIWGKVRPSSPNKRKNLRSSVTTRRKSWGKVPILGSYLKFRGQNLGYLSFICLEAKFGAPTRISEARFGAKPPRPPNMDVPPGPQVSFQVPSSPSPSSIIFPPSNSILFPNPSIASCPSLHIDIHSFSFSLSHAACINGLSDFPCSRLFLVNSS